MTLTKDTFEHMRGRIKVNDVDAIINAPLVDEKELIHTVESNADAVFTWDYSAQRDALSRLYEKAKSSQWNVSTDLDWSTEVDTEKVIRHDSADLGLTRDISMYDGTPLAKWEDKEWLEFGIETRRWMMSNFLHGEQAAMMCGAKIVETAPWYEAKLFAATQVVDEARHAEAFNRYIREKTGGMYQFNWHFRQLVDDTVKDSRWDMTYLGMQLVIESLGLATFGYLREITCEPLLKQILKYVMADEARHVAFGVVSLKEVYSQLTDAEIAERQEFAYEACIRMRDRFLQQEVYERMGVSSKQIAPILLNDPGQAFIRKYLLAKVVPNCAKLGLLDRNNQWLRRKFEEMEIIEFEHLGDTEEEFVEFIHQF